MQLRSRHTWPVLAGLVAAAVALTIGCSTESGPSEVAPPDTDGGGVVTEGGAPDASPVLEAAAPDGPAALPYRPISRVHGTILAAQGTRHKLGRTSVRFFQSRASDGP